MQPKQLFTVRGTGRFIGSLGVSHAVELTVEASSPNEALLVLYDTHEHCQVTVRPVDTTKESQK